MSISSPPVDRRDAQQLLSELRALVPFYVPNWDPNREGDLGVGLSRAFVDILEDVIVGVNEVPKRNFIEFLNFIGVDLASPRPSKAPITFTLSQGVKHDVFVPSGTKVEAPPPPNTGGDPLTFETEENILATRSKLVEVFSVDAEADRIYRHTKELEKQAEFIMFPNGGSNTGFIMFPKDGSNNNLQKHTLYLGHPDLLNLQNEMIFTLRFTPGNGTSADTLKKIFENCDWHYNWIAKQMEDDNGDTGVSSIHFDPPKIERLESSQVSIELKTKTEIKKTKFKGTESFWIGCTINKLDNSTYARIKSGLIGVWVKDINIDVSSDSLVPDHLSYNGIPLQPLEITSSDSGQKIKILYPFGKIPRTYDCFYIANKSAFSKKGDRITIEFSIYNSKKLIDSSEKPLLSWEYWNGKDWSAIFDLDEVSTEKTESVSFPCPADISSVQVSGKENYWIRVRIASGDYGKERIVQTNGTIAAPGGGNIAAPRSTFTTDTSNIKAPELVDIKISFLSSSNAIPKQCLAFNNLLYENCLSADEERIEPFELVKTPDDEYPSFYLGFDQKIEKGPISVLFSIREHDLPDNFNPHIKFYYYSSSRMWARLDAVDNTAGLTQRAAIKFFFPPDFDSHLRFGRNLYWIKGEDVRKKLASSQMQQQQVNGIPVRGMYLNTVSAVNSARINEELLAEESLAPSTLASATAVNKKRVILSKLPIIQDGFEEKVLVDETKFLTEEELDILRAKGHIKENGSQTGSPSNVLVLWQKVSDIYESGPTDRHFTIDYSQGMLEFGDGAHGKALPPGRNKILVEYATGGGNQGNARANEIKTLKSLVPFIDSVSNLESGEGGFQGETSSQALTRGPQGVRHRGQAVTPEDFEWLIREKFPTMARIKCMPTTWIEGGNASTAPGKVTIAVVPNSAEEKPFPSLRLLKDLDQYLAELSSNVMVYFKHIKVIPPAYTRVSVSADIYPVSINLAPVAESKALESLGLFLHPLKGGPKGEGWEFGKIACISDIYALFERIEEVNHVENLSLKFEIEDTQGEVIRSFVISENDNAITIPREFILHALMYNGSHNLALRFTEVR
jgi:hypothetical protein